MSATGDRAAIDRGATLIEMLVVVGILGLIAGLVFPTFTNATRSAAFEDVAEHLNADLRTARADAAREGHGAVVELESDGRGYTGPRGSVSLPAPVRIESDTRSIQFFADGSSSGGAWRVVDGARGAVVDVDEVTGAVRSRPG